MKMLYQLLPHQKLKSPFVKQTSIIHGGDYNPDQWLPMVPDIVEQDVSLMQAMGINSASIGIFSWTTLEPEEGNYNFSWLDRVLDAQAQIGNRVILATPSGAMPVWLARKYPDARRVDRRGLRSYYGNRHNHCWSSPSFHDRVKIINTLLAERYKDHPAVAMWHVSNELSGECYCDLCRESWAKWLEKKYGSVKHLNDSLWSYFWSHEYKSWHDVEPTDGILDGIELDWKRFTNQQLIDWYTFEAEILRGITPDIPITTNFMTTSFGHDYQKIGQVVDVITDDQYPVYDPDRPDFIRYAAYWSFKNDLYRCMKPDHTFMLMESCPGSPQWKAPQKQKRPNFHRLEMLQAIAHGADGTCYFQFRACRGSIEKFHGSVVEHWGTERHTSTRRYRELRSLSDLYRKLEGVVGTSVRPEIAIIYDWDSKWAQQLSSGTGVHMPNWSESELHYYDDVAVEHYMFFWKRGVPVDVIPNDRNWSQYKVVVLPMHWIMTPALAIKIRDYVSSGGRVVATWDTGMSDESNRILLGGWPGEGLNEVFGLWIEEVDRLKRGTLRAIKGISGCGSEVATITHLEGAKVLAIFDEDYYSGQPAVTVNNLGKGQAYFIGTRLNTVALDSLYSRITAGIGLSRIFSDDLPEGVTAQIRGTSECVFIFILNFTGLVQKIRLGQLKLKNIETDQFVENEVTLSPFGADVFNVMQPS